MSSKTPTIILVAVFVLLQQQQPCLGADNNINKSPFEHIEEFPAGMVQPCAKSADCQLKGAVCAYGNCSCLNSERVAWRAGEMVCERIQCVSDQQCNEEKLPNSQLLKITMYKCDEGNGNGSSQCICQDGKPDKHDVTCDTRRITLLGLSMTAFMALYICLCVFVPVTLIGMCIASIWAICICCEQVVKTGTSSSKAI